MLIRQLFDKNSCTFTYLIGSKDKNSIIIDPVLNNVDVYLTLINQLNLNLVYSLETHTHADHISGSGELRNILNCESIVGNESGIECASKLIEDNEYLTIDDINIRVLYTPGHTNDSYCFLVDSIKPGILFTGDTLLIRGTGRTDFQNGDPSKLYDSITNKIFILYDDTEIYPGHDYNGFSKSTIEEEKNYNPRLNLKSKKEFIDLMNNLDLPDPDMMDIAIPLNENCGLEK